MDRYHENLYIGGDWVTPRGRERIEWLSAATGEILGSVPAASSGDISRAVDAAQGALNTWSRLSAEERGESLRRFADSIEQAATAIGEAVCVQNGMPIAQAPYSEASVPANLLRYYASLAEEHAPRLTEKRDAMHGGWSVVRRVPQGVVAAIAPSNFPQTLAFTKIAPALAAGCPVILKPSPDTVLDSFIMAEAAVEAGLPAGILSVLPGGGEVGRALITHRGVERIAFTGSTESGRQVAAACADRVIPMSLELGGNSAAIVLDDFEPARIPELVLSVCFPNNGQACYSCSRILVPAGQYSAYVDAITAAASDLIVGDPLDPATQIGPLVSHAARETLLAQVASACARGARVTTGGAAPPAQRTGWFVAPTVLTDVDSSDQICQEELFGPAVVVLPYRDVDDAIDLANDSRYGLAGSVWSSDSDWASQVASRIYSGSVGVNGFQFDIGTPFGGWRCSGVSCELGPEAFLGYHRTQTVLRNARGSYETV